MLSVSSDFTTAISQPSRQLKSRVTIGSNIIADDYIQGITHNSSIIASDDFEIGTAVMSTVDIELFDKDGTLSYQFENQEINTEIAVKLADTTFEYASLGLFTIEKAVRSNKKIKLTGCDRMYKFEKDYVSTLVYPATLLQIAQDVCSKAGVPLVNTSFVNSTYSVPLKPVLEGVTLRKAIAQVAELAGGYARITRDGKLEIVNIGVAKVVDIAKANYIDFNSKDLVMASIDKVIVKVGAELATSGTGTNPIYIVDNMFCQNPNNVVAALFTSLNGLSYMPYQMRWQGNPALECGDKIAIITDKGTFTTIVGSKKLNYSGGLREEYKAPGKSNTEKNSTGKGNIAIKMENYESEVKVLKNEISQRVKQEIFNDLEQRTATAESSITEQADKIALKIDATDVASGYATKSSVELTDSQLRLDFSSSGSYNYFLRTCLFSVLYGSVVYIDGEYTTGYDARCKANRIKGTMAGGGILAIRHHGVITKNGTYSVSFYAKQVSGIGSPEFALDLCDRGTTKTSSVVLSSSWKLFTFENIVVDNFDSTYCFMDLTLFGVNGTVYEYYISHICINEGPVALPWTPNPAEIHDGNTIIDGKGVSVYNGALYVKNANGDTTIDGSKLLLKVLTYGNGSLVIANGATNASISIPHNLGYSPVFRGQFRMYNASNVVETYSDSLNIFEWTTGVWKYGGRMWATDTQLIISVARASNMANSGSQTFYYRYFIEEGVTL